MAQIHGKLEARLDASPSMREKKFIDHTPRASARALSFDG